MHHREVAISSQLEDQLLPYQRIRPHSFTWSKSQVCLVNYWNQSGRSGIRKYKLENQSTRVAVRSYFLLKSHYALLFYFCKICFLFLLRAVCCETHRRVSKSNSPKFINRNEVLHSYSLDIVTNDTCTFNSNDSWIINSNVKYDKTDLGYKNPSPTIIDARNRGKVPQYSIFLSLFRDLTYNDFVVIRHGFYVGPFIRVDIEWNKM